MPRDRFSKVLLPPPYVCLIGPTLPGSPHPRCRTQPVGWLRGSCWVQSRPGRRRCGGVGRKPTSPAQRQETRATWAASEPRRHLALRAARLGLGLLAARHGAGGPVLCPLFAEGGGERGLVLQRPKGEAAARAPGLFPSFCWESTVRPSSGTCPGSGCQCPAVACARDNGRVWAVARGLCPGPGGQTRPQHDGCPRVCSHRCFPAKEGRVLEPSWQGFFFPRLRSFDGHPEVCL